MKLLAHLLIILASSCLLVSCSSSPNVEFEPVQTGDDAADAEEAPAESVEAIPYSEGSFSSAEKLYGESLTDQHPLFVEAVKMNPNLGYTVFYFDFNSTQLKDNAQEALGHHAQFLQDNPQLTLVINGHADKQGSAGYNLALGERRAIAVQDVLLSNGVSTRQIKVVSFGEEQPAVEGDGEEVYSRNRRAELIYR